MGGCFSRSAGPNSPYPGGSTSSPRPTHTDDGTFPSRDHDDLPGVTQGGSSRREPLTQHINKPLRRHKWKSKRRRWTSSDLAREREEYFDTRVTGRQEVWQTLHAALQVLWQSPAAASDSQDDALATAQTIINAAEISLPTGDLSNGAYDALGNYYQLPEWVVSDPENLTQDGVDDGQADASIAGDDTAAEDEDAESDDERREKKGKAVVEMVTLRARLSESGRDVQISVALSDTVKSVTKKITEKAALPSKKRVRIAYMGKILNPSTVLEETGWHPGHIVNALVFDK